MSKQLQKAEAIEVRTNMVGVPVSLTRNGRREKVVAIYEHWRLSDEWWGDGVERDYFRVRTATGAVIDIYRDTKTSRWYLNRIYD